MEENHFKIRVAKAKDLPPSWYDLVLRPEKFEQHINTLRGNPYGITFDERLTLIHVTRLFFS